MTFFVAIALFSLSGGRKKTEGEVEKLLEWKDAQDISWAMGILMEWGLAIASALKSSGLVEWIGKNLILNDILIYLLVIVVVTAVVFLTEINSNTVTTYVLLPVLVSVSNARNPPPFLLMVTATGAASYAFKLPP